MKLIKLTQGKFAMVDDSDYDRLSCFKWHAHYDGYNWYARRSGSRKENNGKTWTRGLHTEIMGTPLGMRCDHIDGNGLNCQRGNMRICTHAENMRNKKSWGDSRYLGVSFHNGTRRWVTQLSSNGVKVFYKYFNSEENAAIAYNIVAEKYHGEFANFNRA